jgi:5-hydroxyisourate hydrolase
MTGRLTTHVLDTARGRPGSGIQIDLFRLGPGGERRHLATVSTNDNGRTDAPLLEGEGLIAGSYELVFHVGAYFRREGLGGGAAPAFLDTVPVRFGIAQPGEHYHVPLLVSPWSYGTYRGS